MVKKSINAAPGTILHEIICYLRKQEHEVTTAQIANALGRSIRQLQHHLAPAKSAGLLSCRKENKFAFWKLGHNLDRNQPPPELSEAEDEAQRVIKVSMQATSSIFAYARERGAAPFSCAMHTDGRLSIERHGRLLLELTKEEAQLVVREASSATTV